MLAQKVLIRVHLYNLGLQVVKEQDVSLALVRKGIYMYPGLLGLLMLAICISTMDVRILSTPTIIRTRALGLSMILTIPLILLVFVIQEYACQRIKLSQQN